MITPKNFYPLAQKFLPDVLSSQTEEYLPLFAGGAKVGGED
jgi:hypothetical protein